MRRDSEGSTKRRHSRSILFVRQVTTRDTREGSFGDMSLYAHGKSPVNDTQGGYESIIFGGD